MKFRVLISQFLFFFFFLLNLLFLGGCDQNTKTQSAIISGEETIAVVNNKKISLAKFHTRLHSFLERYRQFILNDEQRLTEIREIVINQLIGEELVNQEASRKGIQVPEEEMETIIAESSLSDKEFKMDKFLNNNNLNETEWKNKLKQYLIRKKLIQKEVIDKIPITKREISSYYKTHRQKFGVPQAFKVRNITLSTEEEAKAIYSQILRGKNFTILVREHSISPDKIVDGDLGFIKEGELPEEMENAIFSLGFRKVKKQVSQIVYSQDGYHIFKLEKYQRRHRLSLDQARPLIKKILIEQKLNESYARWLDQLKKNATISIDRVTMASEEGF